MHSLCICCHSFVSAAYDITARTMFLRTMYIPVVSLSFRCEVYDLRVTGYRLSTLVGWQRCTIASDNACQPTCMRCQVQLSDADILASLLTDGKYSVRACALSCLIIELKTERNVLPKIRPYHAYRLQHDSIHEAQNWTIIDNAALYHVSSSPLRIMMTSDLRLRWCWFNSRPAHAV